MKKLNLLEKLILQHCLLIKKKKYLTFNSDILAQEKIVYNHEPIVNIYTVYTILHWPNSSIDNMKNYLLCATVFDKKNGQGKDLHLV